MFGLADHGAPANERARAIPAVTSAAEPIPSGPWADGVYIESLGELSHLGLAFLVGGTDAVRWLAKVRDREDFFDHIFASSNGTVPVTESWFAHAREATVLAATVRLVGPTEPVWPKGFFQTRERHDGTDVINIILKQHQEIDWVRLLAYMELHWKLLLAHLLNFRWIYPSERHHVPHCWVMNAVMDRLSQQLELPSPERKACCSRMLSLDDSEVAVRRWALPTCPARCPAVERTTKVNQRSRATASQCDGGGQCL